MKRTGSEESDARRLVRFVEALVRIDGEQADPTAARGSGTEVDRAEVHLKILSDLGEIDAASIVAALVEQGRRIQEDTTERLRILKLERCDVARRRNELAAEAKSTGWLVEHRDKTDAIPPFVLTHAPSHTFITLGGVRTAKLGYPTGAELMRVLQAQRDELDHQMPLVEPDVRAKVLPTFEKDSLAFLTLKDFGRELGLEQRALKRKEVLLLYFLGRVRGRTVPGLKLEFRAPALSQQGDAFELPRTDRPGSDRIYQFRLEATAP